MAASNGSNGNGAGRTGRRRGGRGRRRVRRALPAQPAAPGSASRRSCSRPATTSAARGTGTAIRAPAATSRPPTTRTRGTPSSRPSGRGRRSTPRSPRSCATCSTSPTSTTCARTSASARPSTAAAWDDATSTWSVTTGAGDTIRCRWYVMATGCLSVPKDRRHRRRRPLPAATSTSRAAGRTRASTSPASGSASSAPARRASSRSRSWPSRPPRWSCSSARRTSRSRPTTARRRRSASAEIAADRDGYREAAKWSRGGVPGRAADRDRRRCSRPSEQRRRLEAGATRPASCSAILGVFADQMTNKAANDIVAEFLRDKIRSIVDDPETAETLCPKDHPFGTKRPCLDTGYYETFNLPHVRLVDLRKHADHDDHRDRHRDRRRVVRVRRHRLRHRLRRDDRRHRRRRHHRASTASRSRTSGTHGPTTYLGLTTTGFPNLFMITGPGSPSVLSNMAVSIEQHVDWVADRIDDLREPRASSASSRPTPPRPAGCSTSTTAPTSRSTRRRTRGTWAPTCPASRGCSCPTSAASTATAQICDEVVERGLPRLPALRPGRHAGATTASSAGCSPTCRWC